MNDQFESYPEMNNSRLPDSGTMLSNRILKGNNNDLTVKNDVGVDPYELMLNKKKQEDNSGEIDPKTIVKWKEADVQRLEDYCAKMGIVGFSCGKMNPLSALAMLKQQVGDDYTDVSMEERAPGGYQKIGTVLNNNNNSNKKQIILG